jgi:hypothetical protein
VCEPKSELGNLVYWIDELTVENLSVVLVVDQKYPDSVSFLSNTVRTNPSIRLEIVSFSNPGEAREYGRRFVDTEFVCFWDADDIPNVSQIMNGIKEFTSNTDLLIGRFRKIQFDDPVIGEVSRKPTSLEEIFANPGLWRMIFRTESIKHAKFPKISMAEDQIFFAELRPWTLNYMLVEEMFYNYSIGRQSQLTNNANAINDLSTSIELLILLLKNEPINVGKFYLGILLASQLTSLFKRKKFLLLKSSYLKILRLVIQKPSLIFPILRSSFSTYRMKIVKNV